MHPRNCARLYPFSFCTNLVWSVCIRMGSVACMCVSAQNVLQSLCVKQADNGSSSTHIFPPSIFFSLEVYAYIYVHTHAHTPLARTLLSVFSFGSQYRRGSRFFFLAPFFLFFFFLFSPFFRLFACSPKTLSKNPHVTSHKDQRFF